MVCFLRALQCFNAAIENYAGCGKMILGSDSHTRYGALGTMAIGEGGGELAKQLLEKTYDIPYPRIIGIKFTGTPKAGIGPHDVALSIIGKVFKNGYVKNSVMEFFGNGIANLDVEFRNGIDVMTTETTCLTSIWITDEKVKEYLKIHGREKDFKIINPNGNSYYDGLIEIDLSKVDCMMALPFHPSNVCSIKDFNENPDKYIKIIEEELIKSKVKDVSFVREKIVDGTLKADQALVSGCSGGLFENIVAMADILKDYIISGDTPTLGINPASQPVLLSLSKSGVLNELTIAGATMRPCICGPCFGVTDVPANKQLSIRHMTRNYFNREGAKSTKGQVALSILMDARSIAATVKNGGKLTPATDLDIEYREIPYYYDEKFYEKQVIDNFKKSNDEVQIRKGPNIEDWPEISKTENNLLLKVVGSYTTPVTTDDLSPSGDAVAYRSNPLKLAGYFI